MRRLKRVATVTEIPHAGGIDDARTSAAVVVPLVLDALHPASVLDVGCGTAGWLAEFERGGVADICGVDADYVRPSLMISDECFVAADLTRPLHLGRTFDLVVSVEVAEHLPEYAAEVYVESLVRHGSLVLFSAATPGATGPGHVNVRWPTYWTDRFRRHGYAAADPFRPLIWNESRIAWWYRQNLILVGTTDAIAQVGVTEEPVLPLIHPENMLAVMAGAEITEPRTVGVREAVSILVRAVRDAARGGRPI